MQQLLAKIDLHALAAGLFASPVVMFLSEYVFDDAAFLITLTVLVSVDTALGVLKGYRKRNLSSTSFSKVFTKLLVYFALLIAAHAAAHLKVHGKPDVFLAWVDSVIYAGVVFRELLSIVEKAGALGVILPPWVLNKFRDFDDDGKINNSK